jgi:hypothetical protein
MSLLGKGLVQVRVAPTKLLVICIYTGAISDEIRAT